MASFLKTVAILATAVSAIPYPPDVAIAPPVPSVRAFFGNKHGNFMNNKTKPAGVSVLATGGYVTGGAAVSSINNQDGIGAGTDHYTMYYGDGSAGAGWPYKENWVSFEDMFNNNKAIMFNSCGWNWNLPNDSGPEVGAIYDAIQQVAIETKVDHRFILAVIIQESGGCTRAPTSNYGVRNPGLMQDHNGDGTCNSDYTGQIQTPCPNGVITQMIREGTAGTNDGDGLAQTINQATNTYGVTKSRAFYIAARLYNSGSVAGNGDLGGGIATHCYASDIANRLTGWVLAAHECYLDG
ncbi:hypothetical protein PVAG01_01754 [Phlyctema vagabunda]|uniref:Glycoside hydrolase n=1 Tax=Phlyctema vagabunda TaxID=108571 RepID=A0ABR4PY00_9HELO